MSADNVLPSFAPYEFIDCYCFDGFLHLRPSSEWSSIRDRDASLSDVAVKSARENNDYISRNIYRYYVSTNTNNWTNYTWFYNLPALFL